MRSIRSDVQVFLTLFCFLLSLVSPLRYGWAADPDKADSVSSNPQNTPETLVLDEAGGKDYVQNLIAKINALPGGQDDHVVSFLHIGTRADPNLIAMVRELAAAGVEVRGHVLTQTQFDEAVNDYSRSFPTEKTIEQYLVSFEGKSLSKRVKDMVRSRFSLSAIGSRIHHFKTRLFGLPNQGITFVEHFLKKNDQGKWKRRYSDNGWAGIATISTIFASAAFSGAIILTGMDPKSWGFVLSNIFLAGWVFTAILFSQEVNSFKMQGFNPYFDSEAPPGEQLVTNIDQTNSRLFFGTTTVLQEWLLVAILLPLLLGPANVPWINGLTNGFLSAFSYLFPERIKGVFLKRAEQAKAAGLAAMAKYWNRIALIIAFTWWNLAFPAIKNSHLLFAGDMESNSEFWAAMPLIVFGTAGFLGEIALSRKRILRSLRRVAKRFTSSKKQRSCATLVSVEVKSPS